MSKSQNSLLPSTLLLPSPASPKKYGLPRMLQALFAGVGILIVAVGITLFFSFYPVPIASNILGTSDVTTPTPSSHIAKLTRRYAYWHDITIMHPDYRDAHYQAALIAYSLGKKDEAKKHVEQVKRIDPNFSDIEKLESLLTTP